MNELSIKTVFEDIVKKHMKCQKFFAIHTWKYKGKHCILLVYEVCVVLTLSDSDPRNVESCKEYNPYTEFENEVKIVANENDIYLMDGKGFLGKFVCTYTFLGKEVSCGWHLETIKLGKVLAITEHEGNILIISTNEDESEIYIRKDVNHEEAIVCSIKNLRKNTIFPEGKESVVVPFFINGNHWVAFLSGKNILFRFSDVRVISTIQIKSQNCQLVCFENGKLLACFTSGKSSCCVFLTKNIKCIEKCFCNETCLLWSDGLNFHHTELIFSEKSVTLKHFEVKCNITGIIAFVRFCNSIIAVTINNTYYHITLDYLNFKKEMVQNPSEILSKIYNESLKIGEFQKNLATAFEYLNFKDVIQCDQGKIELNREGNYFTIKNTLGVTFKKEFWKIKLMMTNQKCEYTKVVDLDIDLLKEMTIKVQNPFDNVGMVKVYLVGEFKWEILHFYVGMVGEDVDFRKGKLKKMLNEINRQRNPNCLKI